ncbi:MAG: AsmA-like C-terminal region-containing protein, partial [Planctomycetota bacterium]
MGVVCAALAGFYLYYRADESLRLHVQQTLQSQYPDLKVMVQSARVIEKRGFEIMGLSLEERGSQSQRGQLATVDRVLVRCDPRIRELLEGRLTLTEVVFQHAVIRGSIRPDGSWSLTPLFQLPEVSGRTPPRARIENGSLEIVDTTVRPPRLLIFRNLNASIKPISSAGPGRCPPAEVAGSFSSDYAHQVSFAGTIRPCEGRWEVTGQTKGLMVSPSLFQSLPTQLANSVSALAGLQAQMELQFSSSYDPSRATPLQYVVQGNARRGRIDDPRLPSPVTGLAGQLVVHNGGVRITEVEGRLAGAPLEFEYYREQGRESITGSVRGLQVDPNPPHGWPPRWQSLWQSFQPEGVLGAAFVLQRPWSPGAALQRWQNEIRVDCHRMAFQWEKVPYPLRGQSGAIVYENGRLTVSLKSQDPTRPIEIEAEIVRPGQDWTGWVTAKATEPLKIDDQLVRATSPGTQRLLRQFKLQGDVQGQLRVERDRPQDPPYNTMAVQLLNGEMRHEQFPYPVRHIRGTVIRNGPVWEFRDFVGHNDRGVITCAGDLKPTPTSQQLTLHYVGTSIPLQPELRAALPAKTQRLWDELQPQGVIDHLSATYTWDAATNARDLSMTMQNRPHTSRAQGQPLSIRAKSFPFTIHDVVGTVRYRNGEVQLERLRGRNGNLQVVANGRAWANEQAWGLNLEQLSADQIRPSPEVMHALPPGLRRFVERTQFDGTLAMQGRMSLTGLLDGSSGTRSTWDLDVDIENGSLGMKWPIRQIAGQVHLRGASSDQSLDCVGELNCDSLMWRGGHVTNLRGPIWFDQERMLLGQWTRRHGATEPQPPVTGNLFGGQFELDAQLFDSSFELGTRFRDADLQELVRDLANRPYRVTGRLSGGIELTGETAGTHTLRGKGELSLQDTDLYELPFMLSLLKTLRTGSTDRTAFSSSDMAFRIRGDRIYFDQLDLKGSALTLKGVGDVGFDRDLSLDFYSLVGREENYLPAVRSLLGIA